MAFKNQQDMRAKLVASKYFTLRPKPLEQWLWTHRVPATAERLFWLHWDEGMRAGDWCSEVSLKRAASLCCVDVSTVTRAYQVLQRLKLIRRENPGHDPANPFQQAITVTEVLLPPDLASRLDAFPNRPKPSLEKQETQRETPQVEPVSAAPALPSDTGTYSIKLFMRACDRLLPDERTRYSECEKSKTTSFEFNPDCRLTEEERQTLLHHLKRLATSSSRLEQIQALKEFKPHATTQRQLSSFDAARLRRHIHALQPTADANETFRQCLWAIERGSLLKLPAPLAINVAIKKVREGAWTRPHRMPPNWRCNAAVPGSCVAA